MYLGEPVYVVVENVSTRILEYDVITCYGELTGVEISKEAQGYISFIVEVEIS